MSKDNGWPAFPTEHTDTSGLYDGMTLRDYFAAKAMAGYLPGDYLSSEEVAEFSYRVADAMLLERAK